MLPKNCWRQGCCESLEMVGGSTEKTGAGRHSIQSGKSQTDGIECYFKASIIESIGACVNEMDVIFWLQAASQPYGRRESRPT
jgi:hypothetical protein